MSPLVATQGVPTQMAATIGRAFPDLFSSILCQLQTSKCVICIFMTYSHQIWKYASSVNNHINLINNQFASSFHIVLKTVHWKL